MKYTDWTRPIGVLPGGTQTSSGALACISRTALVIMLSASAITGCAGRWFDTRPEGKATAQSPNAAAPGDLKGSAVAYIQGLCGLPREQRDSQLQGLNEALLPNHANISCGRGGGGPPLRE